MRHPLDRVGSTLADRYTIDAEIGRGGMAVVYRARDLRHGDAVAVKILRRETANVTGGQRFAREVRIASRLEHANIVPVLDSGELDEAPYYVMPLIEGETLQLRLRRDHRLPLRDAVRLTAEVAGALAYAHAQGVIHRDIKPSNILLAGGHALVVDFGIARHVDAAMSDRLTESGVTIGTAHYMSPEQASSGSIDGRADIYSLACVMYEMLAGSPPFIGPSPQSVIARHRSDPVPSLRSVRREVPVALEEAIVTALAKEPSGRFAAAEHFKAAIERALPARAWWRWWSW